MKQYYLKRGGTVRGPFDADKIRDLAAQAKLKPSDELRLGEEGEWIDAEKVDGLFDGTSRGDLIRDPLANAAGLAAGATASAAKKLFGATASVLSAAGSAAASKVRETAERRQEARQAAEIERLAAVDVAHQARQHGDDLFAPLILNAAATRPPAAGVAVHAAAERDELVVHPAMFRNSPILFVFCVLTIPVVLGGVLLASWWLRAQATTLTVTNRRSILRRGLLSKYTSEVRHSDVRNVQVGQSFLQRLFGVGEIGISSSGQAGLEIDVSGMPDPERIKRLIDRFRG